MDERSISVMVITAVKLLPNSLKKVCSLLFLLLLSIGHIQAQTESAEVWMIDLDGAIGPASADFLVRGLEQAEEAQAELAVIRLNTPGGLDASMRDIISAILSSPVPVATWVAPSGSRAASAGTYITYASHFAAMAPATNIGSSTPVNLGGGGGSPFPAPEENPLTEQEEESGDENDSQDGSQDESGESSGEAGSSSTPASAMERKIINDAVAYIRGLAELRGRNADWAERSVREAANLSASDALTENVIDLVAGNLNELLTALDGRSVEISGQTRTLETAGAEVTNLEPDWRHEFLSVITNPNIAYILMMIGVYGLILEFYNPGMGLPGVTGIICLLLAGFAMQMLPISYAGLALMAVGIALMVFEVFSPSFGVFGIGGLIAFVLGSIMLMDTDVPGYQISMPLIAAMATASGGVVLLILGALVRARQQGLVSGVNTLVGQQAVAMEDFEGRGRVKASGEIWKAVCETPVSRDERLVITQVDGLTLSVRKSGDP